MNTENIFFALSIFHPAYVLIPVSVPKLRRWVSERTMVTYRTVLVFGFRVAYWTVTP